MNLKIWIRIQLKYTISNPIEIYDFDEIKKYFLWNIIEILNVKCHLKRCVLISLKDSILNIIEIYKFELHQYIWF